MLACAHKNPPPELVTARASYEQAMASQAPQLAPAELHAAKVALDQAEAAYEDDPKAYHTADLAYVAERKAEIAIAHGRIEAAHVQQDAASQQISKLVDETQDKLQQEQQARRDAERRAAEALSKLANVKSDERGLVLTLSGSVLFKTNEAALLPEAQTRLTDVSNALMAEGLEALVIEGHTDSQGDDAYNRSLSERRAQAVKDFLVSKGYESSLIKIEGVGEARPIADNASAEGRANNRRVEIVVKDSDQEKQ